jgi:hypothetical protein
MGSDGSGVGSGLGGSGVDISSRELLSITALFREPKAREDLQLDLFQSDISVECQIRVDTVKCTRLRIRNRDKSSWNIEWRHKMNLYHRLGSMGRVRGNLPFLDLSPAIRHQSRT